MEIIKESAEKLIQYLPPEMNILKVVEECAELQEVLIKYLTKGERFKPKKEKIIEEMGDVIFRIGVLSKMLDIEAQVVERTEEKAKIIIDWIIEKQKQN